MNDREVLQEYVRTRSDAASAELVRRHVDLVYSTARRRAGESPMAADIAQAVFIRLARNAGSVRNADALPGWLYRATCYEAASAIRSEQRRRQRETEAVNRAELEAGASPAWELVAPMLDEAMRELNRVEQDAMVLRFFGNKPFAEVGRILGLTEEAARKRVSRALERLRAGLERRGVKVTSGVLATTLAARAVEAAPAGLAATLTSASLGAGTAGAGIVSTFIHTLAMTKTTAAILAVVAVSAIVVPMMFKRSPTANPVPAAKPPPAPAASPVRASPAQRSPVATVAAPANAPSQPVLARVAALPPLTEAQIENYVEQNKRNAESLLAAYRISNNLVYLTEAATRFSNDPEVQYAVIAARPDPRIQRQWIDAYKASSPDNALAWYFSALEYFKIGESSLAIQDLAEATYKPAFRAELAPTLQAVEELNLSAGREADEAKVAAFQACAQVPHLQPLRELANFVATTTEESRQQGDTASVEALAGMGLVLGSHLSDGSGSQTLINQLVGIAIEKRFLPQLAPDRNDPLGRPVVEVSAAVAQHQAALKELAQTLTPLVSKLDDTELANYMERVKLYGEESALTWLKAKHSTP